MDVATSRTVIHDMNRILLSALLSLLAISAPAFGGCDQNPACSSFYPRNHCDYTKPCLEDQSNRISLTVDTGCYPWWKPCQPFTFSACDVVEWDFGDGTTETVTGSASVSHVWKEPGYYPIQIRIRNARGEKTLSSAFTVVRNPPAFVYWSDDVYTANERDGSITLTLERDGDTSRAVTVTLGTLGCTTSGEEWVVNLENVCERPLTIPGGATSVPVTLRIRDDDTYLGEQRYSVYVYDYSGEAVLPTGGFGAGAEIRLIEDEKGPTLTVGDMTVEEGDSGTRTVRIPHVLSEPLAADLMLWWQIGQGTATLGDDWKANSSGAYFIEQYIRAGQTTTNLEISIIGDQQSEPDETIVIKLERPLGPAVAFNKSEIVVTIADDDLFRLTSSKRRVDSGSKVTFTLAALKTSPSTTTFALDSTDRTVIALPPSVTIAAGASEVTFEAQTLRPGVVTVRAKTPDGKSLRSEIVSELRTSLTFTSASARVEAGGKTYVTLATDPPVSTIAMIERTPATIINAPAIVTIDSEGKATLAIDGLQAGTGAVTATLPEEYGRSTSQIVVNVVPELSPRISSVSPPQGPLSGGTRVTISGVDFSAGCGVIFGGVQAMSAMTDERTLVATAPPHAAGPVDVVLQCGAKTTTLASGYRYTTVKRRAVR